MSISKHEIPHQIDDRTRDEIDCEIKQLPCCTETEEAIATAQTIVKACLPKEVLETIDKFHQGVNFLYFTNLPYTQDSSFNIFLGQFLLLGIVALIGEPFAFLHQHGGKLIQDLYPVEGLEFTNSSLNSKVLGFHTDDSSLLECYRPEGLALYCQRNGQTRTLSIESQDLVDALNRFDPKYIKVLQEPRFNLTSPQSFSLFSGKRIVTEPRRLIEEDSFGYKLAFSAYGVNAVEGDREAENALVAMKQLLTLSELHKSFQLKPGEILILSNSRVCHARTSIENNKDRWLQRCLFREDLNDLHQATNSKGRIFDSQQLFLL